MYLAIDKQDNSILFAENNKDIIAMYLKNNTTFLSSAILEQLNKLEIGESAFFKRKNEGHICITMIPSIDIAGMVKVKLLEL